MSSRKPPSPRTVPEKFNEPMMKPDLRTLAQQRILILDGAMGTMIQRYKLEEDDFRNAELQEHPFPLKGNNDLLALTRPELLREIHDAYFDAGADIAETNTFSSTRIAQADYGLEDYVYRLSFESARIARESADAFTFANPEKPRYVVGSIGPTNRTASLSPDVNNPGYRAIDFEALRLAYREQIRGLLDGGAEALLIETVFDTLNAKAALFAAMEELEERQTDLPLMVSGTITDASGRTLSGQTAEAFLISMEHAPLFSIGLNCALGAQQLEAYVDTLSNHAKCLISAHPNAGLPNEMGAYEQSPEQMAAEIEPYFKRGSVNIIGGCCGTTPDHIAAIARMAARYQPRSIKAPQQDNA